MVAPDRLSVTLDVHCPSFSTCFVINDASPVNDRGSTHVLLHFRCLFPIIFPSPLSPFSFTLIVVCLPVTYQLFFGGFFFSSRTGVDRLWQFPSPAMTFPDNLSVFLLSYIRDIDEPREVMVSLSRHESKKPIRNVVGNVRHCSTYWSAVTPIFAWYKLSHYLPTLST